MLQALIVSGCFFAVVPPASLAANCRDDSQDRDLMQGTWKVVMQEVAGKKIDTERQTMVITKDEFTFRWGDMRSVVTKFHLDSSKKPKTIDLKGEEGQRLAIYEIDKNTMKICYNDKAGGPRPEKFEALPKTETVLLVLQREKSK